MAADQGARAAIGFDPVARPPRQRARRPAPPPAGAASIVGQRRPTAAPAARSHQNENAVIRRRHLEWRAPRARVSLQKMVDAMPFLSAHSGVGHGGGSGGSGGDWLRPGSAAAAAARSASSSAAGRRGQHRRPAPSNRGAGGAISSKRKRRHPAPSSGIGAHLARAYRCIASTIFWSPGAGASRSQRS